MLTVKMSNSQEEQSQIFKKNFLCLFIFERERERGRAQAREGQREREIQNPKQAPGSELSSQSPTWGSNPQTAKS